MPGPGIGGVRKAAVGLIVGAALVVGVAAISIVGRPPWDGPQTSAAGSAGPGISGLEASPGTVASIPPDASSRPTSATSSASSPTPRASTPPVAGHPVWWVILENHEFGSIVGNTQAPYFNELAARYGLATNYYATGHPSEPNYVAMVAGSTLGVVSDGVYHLQAHSIFSQLQGVGRSWRVYAQDDQPGCFAGTTTGGGADGPGAAGMYARKHNPAISFASVADSPAQCRNIEPLQAFDPAAGSFEMIVPNLINDMHDGTIAQGDAFLRALVPEIIGSAPFRAGGVLFITFDEGGSNAGSGGDTGGHVATLIVAADLTPGFRDRAYLDHWALLRTTEAILGVPCLGSACRSTLIGH